MSPSRTGRRCSQQVAAGLHLPAVGTGNRGAGTIWDAVSELTSVQKVVRDESQAKERGLPDPAFHGELEGHLFREHFK